jgi:CIC family chloride channel protein
MSSRLSDWAGGIVSRFNRWRSSDSLVFSGTAIAVGLGGGVGVWLFKELFKLIQRGAFDNLGASLSSLGPWILALIPMAGGLVVGVMMHLLVGEERYRGVAGIMEAVALAGGRVPYRPMPAKTVAAALSIGTGASVGPEDPSVQIGASLGSMFGQWLHFSDERIRSLVAAGSAAGIAAAFNAPISGVFFALEIVLGEISGAALGIVVLSAVSSSVFTQYVSGPQPAFRVPAYPFRSTSELPLYLVLGVLAGGVAALYTRCLYLARDLLRNWSIPTWLKPAAAGLVVGLVGISLPQVLGVGYDTITKIFAGGNFTAELLLVLLIFKLLMTALSIGSGFPGGVFAPSLFLGASLGGAFGLVAQRLLPSLPIDPPAFAMVGMAALLAGAVHAPLCAILLLFEMTNDYRIILPVMFSVIVSMLIAQALQRDSVYTFSLTRRGLRLERGRDVEVLEGITVGEIMNTNPQVLRATDSLPTAGEVLARTRHHGLPVVDDQGNLVGVFTVQDLDKALTQGDGPKRSVGEVCTCDVIVAFPDESIGTALQRMSFRDLGRLPVVSRENQRRLVGLLRRVDLVRAYDLALTRRASMRHRAHQARLGAAASGPDVSVEEIVIEQGAPCDGRHIKEVTWPHDSVVASLRRGRRMLIPHGDTLVKAGDVLVVVAEGNARDAVRQLCVRNTVEKSQ